MAARRGYQAAGAAGLWIAAIRDRRPTVSAAVPVDASGKHGARVLGLFDEDNLPTARARAIAGLPYEEQLGVTAIYFEDSAVGRAWRAWAGKERLSDVDPTTAEAFLSACARGLSGTTRRRGAHRRYGSGTAS